MTLSSNLIRTHQEDALYRLLPDTERVLVCYRLWYWADCEYESVWSFVQRHEGYISIGPDHCDYWLRSEYESILVLSFEELVRQPNLDYV